MCDAFYQGRQNVVPVSDGTNRIIELATRRRTQSGSIEYKEVRNVITPTVATLVAKYNSGIPGWAVDPETGNPTDIANARSSEHALRSQYDTLWLARRLAEAITLTINLGSAYIYPYWDSRAGNKLEDGLFEGDTAIRVLPPGAVLWEAGQKFDESCWHAVELAHPKSYIEEAYGLKNPQADAINAGSLIDNAKANGSQQANMVNVTEYLERPSAKSEGRRLIIVAGKVVESGAYPYARGYEEAAGKPWIVQYTYTVNPTGDRDMGFTQHALDIQRTINKTVNQQNRNKDLLINPPTVSLKGSYKGQGDWIPGHSYEFADPDGKPETVSFPDATGAAQFALSRADSDLQRVSNLSDVSQGINPPGVDNAAQVNTLVAQDDATRSAILGMLAQSHSDLGLRLLLLMRDNYSEKRFIRYTGKAGVQGAEWFKGSQVPKRLNVRVSPGSLEHRTRQQAEAMVMSYADRGWVDPRAAMYAVDAGTTEHLLDDFELDIEWQQRENMRMAALPDSPDLVGALQEDAEIRANYENAKLQAQQLISMGQNVPQPDPPPPAGPWPHAREFDNHKIHMETLNRFRKTEEYDLLSDTVKEVFERHYEEHEAFDAQAEARQFAAQQAQAVEYGQANAAKPARVRGVPSAPAPSIHGQAQGAPKQG